jgi:hypothetical protein
MNKDEIILMADASGIAYYGMGKDREKFIYYLKAFATFIAAAEREACAKVCLSEWSTHGQMEAGGVFAAAIRARGQA